MHNSTIFAQLMQLISRHEFQKLAKETKSEYHARGFTSWNHFMALMFGQLAGQDSLRGIEAGLATNAQLLYHVGMDPIHRSTLAYANENRPHELFERLFYLMLSKCQPLAPGHKFRFKNPLFSIDATTIDLCLSLFDWAKFRTTKGAIKLHVKLNHDGYLPNFMVMTCGNVHEQKIAPSIPLDKGDVVTFDRGYNDFGWLATLDNTGVFFVTRLKKNAKYKVIERRNVSNFKNIYSDQTIELTGFYSKQDYPKPLRRIRSFDPETGHIIVLLTNNFEWSANTIARIYKERWQIELFFKTIKQLLKVKSFLGTSPNAMLSQLWTALIAYLLLSYLKFKSKFQWSLYTLCSILPTNIFAKRNLWDWLNAPFKHASSRAPDAQLTFAFG
ncbi:MAG: IS4 family transposase [Planctomycetes bacterium]|nr:IS4 family transposase [Planctomycetota bacterium]